VYDFLSSILQTDIIDTIMEKENFSVVEIKAIKESIQEIAEQNKKLSEYHKAILDVTEGKNNDRQI
jgi:hypothetical protein